jgi:hypothetical protein
MTMYTIYFNPSDYPGRYVCRQSEITPDCITKGRAWDFPTLMEARAIPLGLGLERINRHPADDPVIVECWI